MRHRHSESAMSRQPSLRLARDIGLTGLALGVQRGEGEIEVMLRRLAGVDGAARELANGSVHATENPWRMRGGSWAGRAYRGWVC